MAWTKFWDMCSGGSKKTEWSIIFIEGNEEEAEGIFCEIFDRDPHNITCDCCGPDFSISEYDSLEEATSYFRGDLSVEQFMAKPGYKFIANANSPMKLIA